jgi:hypothetical protein
MNKLLILGVSSAFSSMDVGHPKNTFNDSFLPMLTRFEGTIVGLNLHYE